MGPTIPNGTSGISASVSGGNTNTASGYYASVSGGYQQAATEPYQHVP